MYKNSNNQRAFNSSEDYDYEEIAADAFEVLKPDLKTILTQVSDFNEQKVLLAHYIMDKVQESKNPIAAFKVVKDEIKVYETALESVLLTSDPEPHKDYLNRLQNLIFPVADYLEQIDDNCLSDPRTVISAIRSLFNHLAPRNFYFGEKVQSICSNLKKLNIFNASLDELLYETDDPELQKVQMAHYIMSNFNDGEQIKRSFFQDLYEQLAQYKYDIESSTQDIPESTLKLITELKSMIGMMIGYWHSDLHKSMGYLKRICKFLEPRENLFQDRLDNLSQDKLEPSTVIRLQNVGTFQRLIKSRTAWVVTAGLLASFATGAVLWKLKGRDYLNDEKAASSLHQEMKTSNVDMTDIYDKWLDDDEVIGFDTDESPVPEDNSVSSGGQISDLNDAPIFYANGVSDHVEKAAKDLVKDILDNDFDGDVDNTDVDLDFDEDEIVEVRSGDSFCAISSRFFSDMNDLKGAAVIAHANGLQLTDGIRSGDKLIVPSDVNATKILAEIGEDGVKEMWKDYRDAKKSKVKKKSVKSSSLDFESNGDDSAVIENGSDESGSRIGKFFKSVGSGFKKIGKTVASLGGKAGAKIGKLFGRA
ncbi:LysM peptidoglycan-binding domain-containing protein [Patescibacteria group bacterium]